LTVDGAPFEISQVRVSQLFGETSREVPADAEIPSHHLLVRAGYVRQLAAGIFSYLPLGWRSVRKIEQILREEMDAIGGQEMNMPVVHPAELWKRTGRWQAIDESLVRFQDRGGRDMVLAMTHEEVVASLAAAEIHSYRQLPKLIYQIQTKFRDEARARGGLIRVREFVMKDSYSLDRETQGLETQYQAHYDAYFRIGARAALPLIAVSSDVGMMGGKVAHEFIYLTPIGEDSLILCDGCGYAANRDVARFAKTVEENGTPLIMERIATPNASTIETLASALGVPSSRTAKAVFFMGKPQDGAAPRLVVGVVRGDMDVNQTQLEQLAQTTTLRPAHAEEAEAAGAVLGYASPVGLRREKATVVVDDLVMRSTNLVAGANARGFHFLNTNAGRDYHADVVGDIAGAYPGAPCARCGTALRIAHGVEVGNIFQLGTRYSADLDATYTDEDGRERPIIMGSYGVGVGRMLACVAEEHRDDRGLALPISIAPYAVTLVGLGRSNEAQARAEATYTDLVKAGVEVLYDDRDVSAGVKFADADLRGLPLRLTVSDRSLAAGGLELRHRRSTDLRIIATEEVVSVVRDEIASLQNDLNARASAAPRWPAATDAD